jgi:hypothetical protein
MLQFVPERIFLGNHYRKCEKLPAFLFASTNTTNPWLIEKKHSILLRTSLYDFVAFLASPRAAYITGTEYLIDGGTVPTLEAAIDSSVSKAPR